MRFLYTHIDLVKKKKLGHICSFANYEAKGTGEGAKKHKKKSYERLLEFILAPNTTLHFTIF